ncbi:MAG: hypothetical protein ACLU38_09400 [Dysosmobacter sp.]
MLEVDTAGMTGCDVPDALMQEMRSSVIFLGRSWPGAGEQASPAQQLRSVPGPSTCTLRPPGTWGGRYRRHPALLGSAKLTGREIVLGFPSVGPRKSDAWRCAAGRHGAFNAAREPEIEDLQGFCEYLRCGDHRRGHIHGGDPGRTAPPRRYYTILPDRIAAAAYLCGAASAGAKVFLGTHGRSTFRCDGGAPGGGVRRATGGSAGIVCRRTGRLTAPRPIRTALYPGFPPARRPF